MLRSRHLRFRVEGLQGLGLGVWGGLGCVWGGFRYFKEKVVAPLFQRLKSSGFRVSLFFGGRGGGGLRHFKEKLVNRVLRSRHLCFRGLGLQG